VACFDGIGKWPFNALWNLQKLLFGVKLPTAQGKN
jgi:hypothetical protein